MSPVINKQKQYNNEDDIWEDIVGLVLQDPKNVGVNLYHLLPMFTNPSKITEGWMRNMITDYNLVKRFNVPLSGNLDTIDAHIIDCFIIIENEITAIENYERKKAMMKNGRK